MHNDLIYTVLDVKTKESNNGTYIVAKDLVESALAKLDAVEHTSLGEITGADLVGATYKHVLNGETMPVIAAQHVTAESGTGLVHTAPGHGMEDYEACRALGILPFSPVNGEGYFTADAGEHFQGLFAFDEGSSAVIDYLKEVKGLVKEEPYKHKYPYDWRTKKPVMLRATAQWFANVGDLQQEAVKALGDVRMIPSVCMCNSKILKLHCFSSLTTPFTWKTSLATLRTVYSVPERMVYLSSTGMGRAYSCVVQQ